MTERTLGFQTPKTAAPRGQTHGVNTRTSLWPSRWPAIALQECIDIVEAAPAKDRSKVKFDLPCQDCPERSRCLNSKRKELGPLLYDREILTRPRSSESSLFPMELFEPLMRKDLQLVPYWHKPFSVENEWKVVQAWDFAWSEKIGGDYLVSMTASVHLPTGKRRLLDIERWQKVPFEGQIQLANAKWKTYNADLVVFESDAAQTIWAQSATRNTAVPVVKHAAAGKNDLATGIPVLLMLLENEKWEFPYDPSGPRNDEIDNFLAEAEAFGWVDGKLMGVGEHDDTVMCWYHLNYGIDLFTRGLPDGEQSFRAGIVPGARQ